MLDSSRAFTLVKILLGLVAALWSLSYFSFATSHYHKVLRHFEGEKARFVNEFLANEIDGQFDGSSISELCANRTWTKGLIFNCDPPPGGVSQVRNGHLNCIRFAMEAGAELIIPEIVRRNDKDIAQVSPNSKGTPRGVGIDYFFDREHLSRSLSTFCPQMKVYGSIDELYNTPMGNPISISVQDLGLHLVNETVIEHPETFATKFREQFEKKSNAKTRTWPFRVNVVVTMFVWPTSYDSHDFSKNFGRLLRFREDVRKLAASAAFSIQKRYKPSTQSSKGFVGIHLRTEEDVWGKFPSYSVQAAYYLDYMVRSKYPIAFLASGATSENITAFTERAHDFNITVVTKKDLLEPEEMSYLRSLTWDQQALVDYELMLRSNLMAGTSESTFAWNLALRRAASTGSVGGYIGALPKSKHIRWQDRLSAIMGSENKHMNFQSCIWP